MHSMYLLNTEGSTKNRANMVPTAVAQCSQSFLSISSEYASSHRGITSLPLQSRTHSPESASCSFLRHILAWKQSNSMISPHILMDIQKAFCKTVKNIILCSWYIHMGCVSTYYAYHDITYKRILCLFCIFTCLSTVDWIVTLMLSGKWSISIEQLNERNTVHIYELGFLKY